MNFRARASIDNGPVTAPNKQGAAMGDRVV